MSESQQSEPEVISERVVRAHLAVTALVTCITAWYSYAYFHVDEYFQIIEFTRFKLGQVEAWSLPWEHKQHMRPWLQPFAYWVIARFASVVGVRDVFTLAFVFRLVTGFANVAALALFLRTTLPWWKSEEEQRLHLRVATLLGFLPYLFVRTSSETGSMAALITAFALVLRGARQEGRLWIVPALARPTHVFACGVLLGFAFEMRFQTAFMSLGIVAWLVVVGGASPRSLLVLALGGALAVIVGGGVDRWGYGEWVFPAWTYLDANVFEGAASLFGTDPPFSYLWMLPANIFLPAIVVLLGLSIVAWIRCPRHPVSWATLPFFFIHNLLAHKEERFLFPMAILSTALVTMALGPSSGRTLRIASWAWQRRHGALAKVLAATNMAGMLLLAFVPLGWHHNVRFAKYIHDHLGDEIHATALPEISLTLPAFHPRIYDLDKAEPEEIARRIETGTHRPWLISDRPILDTGVPGLDAHAVLVWSELPVYGDPTRLAAVMRWVEAYNRHALPPMRRLRFRSLFRVER
jgi:phosphatidylinositol glycan class B